MNPVDHAVIRMAPRLYFSEATPGVPDADGRKNLYDYVLQHKELSDKGIRSIVWDVQCVIEFKNDLALFTAAVAESFNASFEVAGEFRLIHTPPFIHRDLQENGLCSLISVQLREASDDAAEH
jgi:hypothetical protein